MARELSWQPSSVLVTGGAGFVGSHLCLRIRREFPHANVVAMDNLFRRGSELNLPRLTEAGVNFHRGDIRDPAAFPSGPFDLLLECSAEPSVLAGLSGDSPDYLIETNLMGTYRCLEKARLWGSRVIFFSTSRVYPIAPLERHPWTEDATRFRWEALPGSPIGPEGVQEALAHHPESARSLYGFTKFASELLIEEYRSAFVMPALINRCSVLAGPWQMGKVDQGIVALWVLRHHFKKPLRYLGYGGSGKQVRDVLHIDDLADLVVTQIQNFSVWEGWRGNIGGGLAISASLLELTELCRQITGNTVPVEPDPIPRPADLRIFLADCTLAFNQHKWKPTRSLEQIIADTHAWVRAHEEALRPLVF